jgi:hypothetical protein
MEAPFSMLSVPRLNNEDTSRWNWERPVELMASPMNASDTFQEDH